MQPPRADADSDEPLIHAWSETPATADAAAPKPIDVYGPALAQLMQMVAEMQRGQREVTNRLNS